MKYPEILTGISGEPVTSVELWERFRRNEIFNLFSHYVYGECPVGRPDDLHFTVKSEIKHYQGYPITFKTISIMFSDYSFDIKGFYPEKEEPVPAFVYIQHEFIEEHTDFEKELNCPYYPVVDITSRGYAVIIMPTRKIYPDFIHYADYTQGVFSVFSPDRKSRKDSDWATISAWAWGASRVMDYLETDNDINAAEVAVAGHSRAGKTALWCAASDKRFALSVSNASGCTGAAMLRGKTGEHIKDISITDWFCGNYVKFSDNEEMLPVDQHMLLSLIAPRLLYVTSCSNDEWADPVNERLACRLATQVYDLYGIDGAVLPPEPVNAEFPYHEGHIGYHMKTGDHSITPFDWKLFMDFWEIHRI